MTPDVVTFGCRLNAYESEIIREKAIKAGDLKDETLSIQKIAPNVIMRGDVSRTPAYSPLEIPWWTIGALNTSKINLNIYICQVKLGFHQD